MPHRILFDAARKRITIVVTPPVSEHDALECFRNVRKHPEFSTDYGILVNALATDRPPTPGEAAAIGVVLKTFFPKQKIAWVRSDSTTNKWCEVLRDIANVTLELRNFLDLSAAEAWLTN